jgi:flagellin
MALSIATNTGALMAAASASSVNKDMETSMERLSTGKRINSAADDAAGVAIASRLTSEIRGTNQAIRNAQDGQALINTAEGAHSEIESILQRMRELAVQSSNDTNDSSDRANLQLEVDALITEIDRISQTTTWAGQGLLNGTSSGALATSFNDKATFNLQVGANSASANTITANIGATTSAALGLGKTVSSASATPADNPARMSINAGTVAVEGDLVNGDKFEFDIDDVEVSVSFSTTNEYSNDLSGLGAQIKDKIDSLVAAGTIKTAVSVVDNGDGSISLSTADTPDIDTLTITTAAADEVYTVTGNTLSFAGTFAAGDSLGASINGIAVAFTAAANDGLATSATGAAAGLAKKISETDGLENVTVVDNGDGTLSLSQTTTPVIEAAEVTPNNSASATLSYGDNGVLTVGGSFVDNKAFSFNLMGEDVSVTASTEDGFSDSKAGVAAQIAVAINDAGIHGITAAKTANADTVTITAKVAVENTAVNSGSQFLVATTGLQASATLNISSVEGVTTAATYTAGDSYNFEVAGQSFSMVVGTDGFTDDIDGVTTQMIDTINSAGITGLSVAANKGTSAGVTITRDLTGVTSGSAGSTVVTGVNVMDAAGLSSDTSSNGLSVTDAESAKSGLDMIDKAIATLNSQRASLGAASNRIDSTVDNLTNIAINLEGGRGRIEDADFAAESTSLAKSQILQQASTAMLAQANASKQNVLSLLQG